MVSAAKRISKKQLKDDKFVDLVLVYGEKLREHQRLILGGVLVLLLIVLGVNLGQRAMRSGSSEAQQAYSAALKKLELAMRSPDQKAYAEPLQAFKAVRSQFGRKDVGRWAIYGAAYCDEQMGDYQAAETGYREYLEAQPRGEFALAARLGIASCSGSLGRVKPQADMLVEVAESEGVEKGQADAWLYQAAQLYLDAGYFDLAKKTFERVKDSADDATRLEIEQALKALAALPPA